jgi:cytochrome c-type biogenesis protein CcmH
MAALLHALPLDKRAAKSPPRGRTRIWLTQLFLLFAIIGLAAMACASDTRTVDERAQALYRQLMCPICPSETIDQSQVEIAREMREIVVQKLTAGESEQQILDYFSAPERYGVKVLAAPPADGFGSVVWAFPPALFIGAAIVLYLTLKAMRRKRPMGVASGGGAPNREDELAPYLALIDTEYEMSQRTRTNPDPPDASDSADAASEDVKA